MGSELDGDLRTGVPGAHDEHRTLLNLGWVAVLLGVELDDALIQLACESWNFRVVEGAGGHDRVLGEQGVFATCHFESIPRLRQSVDSDSGSDGELEGAGVLLQIVGGLVLGRIGPRRSWKSHPR